MKVVPSDLEIVQAHKMTPIGEIAAKMGLTEDDFDYYGKYKAKISLDVIEKFKDRPNAKLIDVTAITPTPLGEGKTVTTISLTQGLGHIGKKVICTLRQPSLGPVFGIKGGAAGGGYAQVVPMEDLNIHFTGDIHAIETANNLLAAMIDTSILLDNPLNIDPMSIMWRRVFDLNDRALRDIVIGLGGKENGYPRQTGFDIAVASEVMAILALTTSLQDMRERFARIIFGFTYDGKPVTAEQIKAAGSMTVIMKEAIKPNLVQTLEGQPCIMHAGPFANIAHGQNSVLADMIALKCADYVVTESGFGADMGMQKFMDIKCRQSGLRPNCVVVTSTVRSLKMHGGVGNIVAGKPLPKELTEENLPALEKGAANMMHMIKIAKGYGIPVVVSINRFITDTDNEINLLKDKAKEAGAFGVGVNTAWGDGGVGCAEVAELVVKACEEPTDFQFLYPDSFTIKEKIETMAKKIYNADGVSYDPLAEKKIAQFEELGLGNLPINMAKTHLSISHDPGMKNVPSGYIFPIRDIRASVGAGFLYPLAGAMRTMPGLGRAPSAIKVDIDKDGKIVGLF
ncbi:Formate--tetrahydrofolate ligase [Desulfofarcimen acetoxidans DSM 771]|uniref:Formate--tetrahydrofolate ligase n=1 Tax=Desulfofarcimen acetoxidans (strain ATCC 49208 / DSM 771 / KCTC 5769 / VKM B-1644 / 5575) TaxID=485916 RepID=C8W3T0_DESAS|nr:formate--tetrahydrofolate ligase [Desulfofarcimen acetoxidans]ACV61184.1 Formate--tetrahydrofolate ligase [Desulfofarcimen acetoxidans DSM 771]